MATKVFCDRCNTSKDVGKDALEGGGLTTDLCRLCVAQIRAEISNHRHRLAEEGRLLS